MIVSVSVRTTYAAACLLALAAVRPMYAQHTATPVVQAPQSMEMLGTVGPYRVGLNYTLQNNTTLLAAHYFYATQRKNIPLTGELHSPANSPSLVLHGADGSTWQLVYTGNGSNGSAPLNLMNSVGMKGTWTLAGKTLPVTLSLGYSTENPGQRFYSNVTNQPDEAFESMVAKAQVAILSNNPEAAARYIAFPLRVNRPGGKPLLIRNEAELKMKWSSIWTPALLDKLKQDVPHEMFVHEDQAALGDGELWFGDHGLASINP